MGEVLQELKRKEKKKGKVSNEKFQGLALQVITLQDTHHYMLLIYNNISFNNTSF